MVPIELEPPPLAAERGRRRPEEGSVAGPAGPGDEDGGAGRAADAAPAVVVEAADASGGRRCSRRVLLLGRPWPADRSDIQIRRNY